MKNIQDIMGIDRNTAWTILATIMGALIPLIVPLLSKFLGKKVKTDEWEVGKKVETDAFYPLILVIALVFGTVNGVVFLLLINFCRYKILSIFIILFMILIQIIFINSRKSVKLRTFGIKRIHSILIIDTPFFLLTFSLCLSFIDEVNIFLYGNICIILICEFLGISMFEGRYTMYFYSFANITLNTSEELKNINVETLHKYGKWLVIKQNNSKRLILFDNVVGIEYYGEPKYVLNKGIRELLKRRNKS